jgi:hypothetical protein
MVNIVLCPNSVEASLFLFDNAKVVHGTRKYKRTGGTGCAIGNSQCTIFNYSQAHQLVTIRLAR